MMWVWFIHKFLLCKVWLLISLLSGMPRQIRKRSATPPPLEPVEVVKGEGVPATEPLPNEEAFAPDSWKSAKKPDLKEEPVPPFQTLIYPIARSNFVPCTKHVAVSISLCNNCRLRTLNSPNQVFFYPDSARISLDVCHGCARIASQGIAAN
jgi:hypothetical protein